MKELTIEVTTSCDDAFIDRVARKDPFEYWNRCIAPETAREPFILDDPEEDPDFVITKTDDPVHNYKITYNYATMQVPATRYDRFIEALIMFHGFFNVKVIDKEKSKKLPIITIDQARKIEDKVLDIWEGRAKTLDYNPDHKITTKLQAEFLLGMVAVTDILTNAATTKESSISPRVYFSIVRGDYLRKKD